MVTIYNNHLQLHTYTLKFFSFCSNLRLEALKLTLKWKQTLRGPHCQCEKPGLKWNSIEWLLLLSEKWFQLTSPQEMKNSLVKTEILAKKKKNRESYVQNGFPGSEFCILDLEAKQIPKRLKTDLRWLWMESNSPTLNVGEGHNLIKPQIPHT